MRAEARFKRLADRFGFKIKKVRNRPDIRSVTYHRHHLFTIPSVIYSNKSDHRDISGRPSPDYFSLEARAKGVNLEIKQTPYLYEKEQLEKEQG